jgi:hypothetical protein
MNADKIAKAEKVDSQTQYRMESSATKIVASQITSMRRDSRVESPHFFENGRGFRRALFEWRAPMLIKVQEIFRHELRSPANFQRSAGTAPLLRGGSSGRLFFGYFLLAKQKKVTCRRATPGKAHQLHRSLTKLRFPPTRE